MNLTIDLQGPLRELLMIIVGTVLFLAILGILFFQALNLPTVYESWSTKECIRVEDPTGIYTCTNLPEKYHHVWVQ